MTVKFLFTVTIITVNLNTLFAQDPLRFQEELSGYLNESDAFIKEKMGSIVFSGSSSIRMWKNLETTYPGTLNRGFGGSETSDLLFYYKELIVKYKPSKVFIYEGDNDINSGESVESIMKEMKQLTKSLNDLLPDTKLYILSAKPSISRWNLRDQYLILNSKLKELCETTSYLTYVNVWGVMLKDGKPDPDIFIEDDLHLNEQGYALWNKVIKRHL